MHMNARLGDTGLPGVVAKNADTVSKPLWLHAGANFDMHARVIDYLGVSGSGIISEN